MNMIFLGPPAVGKGTHAGKVAEHFGIPIISAGEIFRDEVKAGSALGRKVDAFMKKGALIPDDIVIGVFRERLKRKDASRGYILDGFPRTLEQARALEGIARIDVVVNMDASRETIMARITNRLTCRKCQAIYNTLFVKPRKAGVCDKCGGELYQREDQKPDVVRARLDTYDRQTSPLISYYRKKGILVDVDANGEVDVVHGRVMKALDGFMVRRK
jgi:adenylate kinase